MVQCVGLKLGTWIQNIVLGFSLNADTKRKVWMRSCTFVAWSSHEPTNEQYWSASMPKGSWIGEQLGSTPLVALDLLHQPPVMMSHTYELWRGYSTNAT